MLLTMMMSSVFSALLLGLFPVPMEAPLATVASLGQMQIAPPVERMILKKRLSASGVLIMDVASGQTVYGAQADVERPMASLTKLMTALLIVEHHRPEEWVTVPKGIAETPGSVVSLLPGEQFTVGDLLSALLIASANDAAVALARYHGGSTEAFVKEMNGRAVSLGLTGTQYANPSGMDDPRQWSTPRDIAHLTMFVQKYAPIRDRMGMRGARMRSREGREIPLTHTHALLGIPRTLVREGKTGTTGLAGQCLVSLVEHQGQSYVVVLLHSQQRYGDMKDILAGLFGSVGEATEIPVEETECVQGGGCPPFSAPIP